VDGTRRHPHDGKTRLWRSSIRETAHEHPRKRVQIAVPVSHGHLGGTDGAPNCMRQRLRMANSTCACDHAGALGAREAAMHGGRVPGSEQRQRLTRLATARLTVPTARASASGLCAACAWSNRTCQCDSRGRDRASAAAVHAWKSTGPRTAEGLARHRTARAAKARPRGGRPTAPAHAKHAVALG
jgi:hypothetical protein